jgi:hypothetical protein
VNALDILDKDPNKKNIVAVGLTVSIEKLSCLAQKKIKIKTKHVDIFLCSTKEALAECQILISHFWSANLRAEMSDSVQLPVTQQCALAAKEGIKYAIIIDDTQFNFNGLLKVLNLNSNEMISYVHKDDIVRFMISLLEKDKNSKDPTQVAQKIGFQVQQSSPVPQQSYARKSGQIKTSFYASLGITPDRDRERFPTRPHSPVGTASFENSPFGNSPTTEQTK